MHHMPPHVENFVASFLPAQFNSAITLTLSEVNYGIGDDVVQLKNKMGIIALVVWMTEQK